MIKDLLKKLTKIEKYFIRITRTERGRTKYIKIIAANRLRPLIGEESIKKLLELKIAILLKRKDGCFVAISTNKKTFAKEFNLGE